MNGSMLICQNADRSCYCIGRKSSLHKIKKECGLQKKIERLLQMQPATTFQRAYSARFAYVFSTIFTSSWLTVSSAWAVMHSNTPCPL